MRGAAVKSGPKSGNSGLFRKGHDPRRGRGPKKGAPNAGRPPEEHVEWCRRVVSDPAAEGEVEAVLKDRKHPAFATMWKAVTERAYGKPAQTLALTGPDGGPLRFTFVLEAGDPDADIGSPGRADGD